MQTKTEDTELNSFVVAGPSGLYAEACVWFDLAKPNQVLVVKFKSWVEWYNMARFSDTRIKPPPPSFCADTYEVANAVRDKLNETL